MIYTVILHDLVVMHDKYMTTVVLRIFILHIGCVYSYATICKRCVVF
jgi:hypothetical protein